MAQQPPSDTIASLQAGLAEGRAERERQEALVRAQEEKVQAQKDSLLRGLGMLKDTPRSKFEFNIEAATPGSLHVSTNIGDPKNPLRLQVGPDGIISTFNWSSDNPKHCRMAVNKIPATGDKNEVLKFIASQAAAKGLIS